MFCTSAEVARRQSGNWRAMLLSLIPSQLKSLKWMATPPVMAPPPTALRLVGGAAMPFQIGQYHTAFRGLGKLGIAKRLVCPSPICIALRWRRPRKSTSWRIKNVDQRRAQRRQLTIVTRDERSGNSDRIILLKDDQLNFSVEFLT